MKEILSKDPMSYKQQIKKKNRLESGLERELLVKLRIIKLVEKNNYSQTSVAQKFSCHRNTIGNIVRGFKRRIKQKDQDKIFNSTLTLNELKELLSPIKNKTRAPKSNSRSASLKQERMVCDIFNRQKVKVGPYQMRTYLKRKYGNNSPDFERLSFFERSLGKLKVGCIKGIYKRNKLKIEKKRSASGKLNPLYDYKALSSFEKMHYDTKEITDKKTLPLAVYQTFKHNINLPIYEYNLIDAKSRFRFIAYSRYLNSEFGLKFMLFTVQFIRAKLGIWDIHIDIGADNGTEFCKGSKRKEQMWNQCLKSLNASFYSYHSGFDIRKNLIERSHKTDDYFFLIPRGEYINSKKDFLKEASHYWFFFNFQKPHTGKGMNGRTPYEALKDSSLSNLKQLLAFPTLILEDNIKLLRKTTDMLLFIGEVEKYKKEKNIKNLDQKTFIDLKTKYEFFNKIAQNVLTYYPNHK